MKHEKLKNVFLRLSKQSQEKIKDHVFCEQ